MEINKNYSQIEPVSQVQLAQEQVERITTLVNKINSLTETLGDLTERLGIVENLCKTFSQQMCKVEKNLIKIEDDEDDEDDEDENNIIRFLPQK